MRIALGIPTLNNFQGLAELINSFWGYDFTPFVFPNWKNNEGVSKAWNKIIDSAIDYDLLIISNDDVVLKNGLNNLVKFWNNKPSDCIMATGNADHNLGGDVIKGAPDYSFFAINPREYNLIIGEFDENFSPAYF